MHSGRNIDSRLLSRDNWRAMESRLPRDNIGHSERVIESRLFSQDNN